MDLHELHELQLATLVEVDRVCGEHNIEYFVLYGTLLGAIRHRGFIPWDDDVDVGMKRSEFDRFLTATEASLSDRYFVQTYRTDAGYPLSFAKVRVNGSVFPERGFSESDFHQGAYIDIFPLDQAPNSTWARKAHGLVLRLLKTAALSRSDYLPLSGTIRRIVYSSVGALSRPFTLQTLMTWQERTSSMFNNRSTEWLFSNGGPYGYARETVPAILMADGITLTFESTSVHAPGGWEAYLTHMYGDFLTPPPESERTPRHLS